MIRTRKFFFLPFLDNLTAVGITFLLLFIFGSWFSIPTFAAIATFFMLFTLCGRIYVRMWNLSRKNTARRYGLTIENCVKFMLPLGIFDVVLITFYCLCEFNIIPVKSIIVRSFYEFPDNAPRVLNSYSLFEYVAFVVKFWFSYLICILNNCFVLYIAPVLSFVSGIFGFYMGAKDKQIANFYIKASEKAKKKFNE